MMIASHFWSAAPLDVTAHPAVILAALALAALLFRAAVNLRRRRRARRRLEQHWRDVTAIMRADRQPRVDVTLPLLALLAVVAGSALLGAITLLVAVVACGRRGLAVDNRHLLTAANPTTSGDTNEH